MQQKETKNKPKAASSDSEAQSVPPKQQQAQEEQQQKQHKEAEKAKAVPQEEKDQVKKPQLAVPESKGQTASDDDFVVTKKPSTPSQIEITRSLIECTSYDIKQIVYSLGSYVDVGEIFYSQSVSGDVLYDFERVQSILKPCHREFGSEEEYHAFLQQLEKQFQV